MVRDGGQRAGSDRRAGRVNQRAKIVNALRPLRLCRSSFGIPLHEGDRTYKLGSGTTSEYGRYVKSLRGARDGQVSYHYDPAGRLLNRILSSGAKTDYKYDAANRLSSITNWSADDSLVHTWFYVRDAVGNATATHGTDRTIGYSYDALHRLSIADLPGTAVDESFGYDAVGNRLTKTTASGTFNT